MKRIVCVISLSLLAFLVCGATLNIRRVLNANAPLAPTNATAIFNGAFPTRVTLVWSNAQSTYSNIVIQRSDTSPVAWAFTTNILGTNTTFTNTATWTNAVVIYRLKAIGSNGLSSRWTSEP